MICTSFYVQASSLKRASEWHSLPSEVGGPNRAPRVSECVNGAAAQEDYGRRHVRLEGTRPTQA
jgi:hypothetical protein